MSRDDIDLAFVREFQCSGLQLAGVSSLERYDRVRSAIYKAGRQNAKFCDGMTYAQAFRAWSGRSLEQRAKLRPVSDPIEQEAT